MIVCITTIQRHQVLILKTCKCYLIRKKGLYRCDLVKDLEMGRLSWINLVGPKSNHKYLYIREAGQGVVAHAYNPSTREAKAGGSRGQEIETILVNTVKPHLY